MRQQWGEQSGKRTEEERRSEKKKAEEKKIKASDKVEKLRNTVLFQCFVVPWVEK